jgi:hypothetical protein
MDIKGKLPSMAITFSAVHEISLTGVFSERSSETDPHRFITGEAVGDQICRPPGNLAPGTRPLTGHNRDI